MSNQISGTESLERDQSHKPLISTIIPCFNHGKFLAKAIESVLRQTYLLKEIIVVDDGSFDNTNEIASKYKNDIKYFFQKNKGLSAARNRGIMESKGQMLVFLDADDWLYPQALATNVRYMTENQNTQMVSGSYDHVFIEDGKIEEIKSVVNSNHFKFLLQRNYIGMVATVMFRKSVFEKFNFDETLKAAEDYDLYFNIARNYPCVHHQEKIAAYRIYPLNMSSNLNLMLRSVIQVLRRQRKKLKSQQEKEAYKAGLNIWISYYCNLLYQNIVGGKIKKSLENIFLIFRYKPHLALKLILHLNFRLASKLIKSIHNYHSN